MEGEGEPGTKSRPPMATLASHDHIHGGHVLCCSLYHSRAALWIMITSPVDHKDYSVGQFGTNGKISSIEVQSC